MASLDTLPADQRAVLQLVLQRGRTYDDIAQLLSIDRAAVRERALAAFDALGPQTRVPPERRALITDYLLGQLPGGVAQDARAHLAQSGAERAWARVIASELSPLAAGSLPEIPVEAPAAPAAESAREPVVAATPAATQAATRAPRAAVPGGARKPEPEPEPEPAGTAGAARRGPSSRRGGAILLTVGALVVVAVMIILIVTNSGGSKNPKSAAASTQTGSGATGTTSTTGARVVSQINLVPPISGSKSAGIAEVLRQGNNTGIAIVAQNVPPNTKHPPDAYAVWLYNSPSDSVILGFVNPGVGSNGRLSTAGPLPSNASRYKQLLVTLETQSKPHTPGKIVLEGALTGVA